MSTTQAQTKTFTSETETPENLGPSTVLGTETYKLTSKTIGQDFLIEVAWPAGGAQPGEKLPVIYVLDGNHSFAMAAQIARMLQAGPFPMPRALVVGIGYHDPLSSGGPAWGQLRVRDLTPWVDEKHDERFRNAPPQWRLPPDIQQGGGPAFLAFIEAELKPFIAGRFPVDRKDQSLMGMSLGGIFTLYAMFTAPAAFKRYIAMSPSIYWAERKIFELEAAHAASGRDLPATLFLSMGGLEEGHDIDCAMVSNLYAFEARLRARRYPGLDMKAHVFEGETHMSVYSAAISRGITEVFGGHRDVNDWARVLKA